jgi:hypothetical protein
MHRGKLKLSTDVVDAIQKRGLLLTKHTNHVGRASDPWEVGNLHPVKNKDFRIVTTDVPPKGAMGGEGIVKAPTELSPLSQRSSAQEHVYVSGSLGGNTSFAKGDNLKAKVGPLANPSVNMGRVAIHVAADNVRHPILLHDTVDEGMSPGGIPHIPVNARNSNRPMGGNIRYDRGRSARMVRIVAGGGGGLHLEEFTPQNHNSPRSSLLLGELGGTMASIIALDAENVTEGVNIFLDVFGLL